MTIRDHLSHHSLVPSLPPSPPPLSLSLSLSLSLTVLLSLQPCSYNLLTFVVDTTFLCLCLSLPLCFMCTQPIVIRWIEVSIFPVFNICYANLNKSFFCTYLDDLVELTSIILLARNMLSAFFYSPLVGLMSYLCELDINSSLFGNRDA